ncbi:MAG: amidoligase family protein, partial [Alicyclobacillus shizuokensis]|nr:amidoligase family protein [Alicyclobacillus shizuokensis]
MPRRARATLTAMSSNACRVCHRPLRNELSRLMGVGPVCAKRVRRQLEEILERVMRGEAEPGDRVAYAMSPQERQLAVEAGVRRAYLEQLRQRRRPSREPVVVGVDSATRRIVNEPTTVEWIDRDHAWVESEGGRRWETSENGCTCPDFIYRRSRNPGDACRHMVALRLARTQIREQRRLAREERRNRTSALQSAAVHTRNHPTFTQIDWTVDAERERVLDVWRENRAWDGVYISRDDAAWEALKAQAAQEWEYKYENVLGGTGNTFGVEVEMIFDTRDARQDALRELYNDGILGSPELRRYHSRRERGLWAAEQDASLSFYGVEFVSPVLMDNRDSWQQIEHVTEVLRRHGGYVNPGCGGHVHIGIGPLDHRSRTWHRLAQIAATYEHQLYRIGGADAETYRSTGEAGTHRGTIYAVPLRDQLDVNSHTSSRRIRRAIDNYDHHSVLNARNVDFSGRPTIEMRYPNGTLDHRQIQAQIQVANAIVHQAGALGSASSQVRLFLPKLSEREKQMRYGDTWTRRDAVDETKNFREFLDVLANPHDRLAATWLWLRG